MKLQTKLIIAFIAGLVIVITLAQVVQYFNMTSMVGNMAEKNTKLVRDMVEENAINIFTGVERSIASSLQRGEMEKFDRMVKEQTKVPGLLEFSLYDQKGKIYSSTVFAEEKIQLPPKHPEKVGDILVTTNCIRCHDAQEIKLPIPNLHDDLLNYLQGRKEKLVRQSPEVFEIFQPQISDGSCNRCHRNWQTGTVTGYTHFKFSKASLLELEGKINQSLEEIRRATLYFSIFLIIAMMVVLAPLAYFYTRKNLVLRLNRLGDQVKAIAGGDLSRRIAVPAFLDEISTIATHVNTMADNLAKTAATVGDQAETVAKVVRHFEETRVLLAKDSQQTNDLSMAAQEENHQLVVAIIAMQEGVQKATSNIDAISISSNALHDNVNTVAAAAEQASQNVITMASAAEQMTANVNEVHTSLVSVSDAIDQVASSIQQMTDSLNDVRIKCQEASQKSSEANRHAHAAEEVMSKLSDSAQEIGKVVELINNIAEQTNMLALNASIEAAGAGQAGLGFSVVANEVKELARQTTKATSAIDLRIADMQNSSYEASLSTQKIAQIVEEINQANNDISCAMDHQSIVAEQVAGSTQKVVDATGCVTYNAQELGLAANEVARAASEAALGTSKIARSSSDMANQAQNVAEQSDSARTIMQFASETTIKTSQFSTNVQEKMSEACRLAAGMNLAIQKLQSLGEVMHESSLQLTEAKNALDQQAKSQNPGG